MRVCCQLADLQRVYRVLISRRLYYRLHKPVSYRGIPQWMQVSLLQRNRAKKKKENNKHPVDTSIPVKLFWLSTYILFREWAFET